MVRGVVRVSVALLAGVQSASAAESLDFDLVCERYICQQEIVVGLFNADTGEELVRITVQPETPGVVPVALTGAIKSGELSPDKLYLTVVSEDLVSTRKRLSDLMAGKRRLQVWPASDVTSTFQVAGGELPEALAQGAKLLLWPADQPDQAEAVFETLCPVEENRLECRMPAGSWDLRIDLAGLVPVHRWDLQLTENESTDLGPVKLLRGATVIGFLEVVAPEIPDLTQEATVEITPSKAFNPYQPDEQRRHVRVMKRSLHPQQDGSFSLAGVAVESHLIQASVTGVGESEVRHLSVSQPVELSLKTPLLVSTMISAVLQTGITTDQDGGPLRVHLREAVSRTDGEPAVYELSVDPSGFTELPPVNPGVHFLTVMSSRDEILFFRELRIDMDQQVIVVDLQWVPVQASVKLAGEPLADAQIELTSPDLAEAKTRTDEEGQFEVLLPVDGRWMVEITAQNPSVDRRVEVEVVLGSPIAIELEITGVRGTVKNEGLNPVEGARILLIGAGRSIQMLQTDEHGSFESLSMVAQEYMVQAMGPGGDANSYLEVIEVEEGQVVDLDLRLGVGSTVVRGRLMTHDGEPVVAKVGLILARNIDGEPVSLQPSYFQTEADGRFATWVPENAAAFRVVTAPQGFDLLASDERLLAAGTDDEYTFIVDRSSGGVVELIWPNVPEMMPFVMINETGVPSGLLSKLNATGKQDETMSHIIITDMPGGRYRLCRANRFDYLRAISGSPAGDLECEEAYLARGGHVRLELADD